MYFNLDNLLTLVAVGRYFDYSLAVLLILLVPTWFIAHTTGNPIARRLLRILFVALLVWLIAFWMYGIAVFATARAGHYAALMLLAPLALIYGFRKARRRKARMAERGTGLAGTLMRLFPLPIFVALSLGLAIADRSIADHRPLEWLYDYGFLDPRDPTLPDGLSIGNGLADALLSLLVFFGYGALILFFLTVPYLMGSVVAALLLVLDGLGLKALLRERGTGGERPVES